MALVRVVAVKAISYRGFEYAPGDIIDFLDDTSLLGQWVAAGLCTVGSTQRSTDDQKYDCALVPTSLASTNLTGQYFNMANTTWAEFICIYGPLATTGTVKLEVLQAKDVIGTGAAALPTATLTTNATEITHVAAVKKITLATFVNAATITITAYRKNSATALYSYTYTADAAATVIASRQFSIAGTDTQDAVELLSCLNDATYGTPGIYWTAVAGACTGQAIDDQITFTITCSVDNATDVRTEPQGSLIVRVDKNALTAGYNWVAAKVTTAAGTVVVAVVLARHGPGFSPNIQQTDLAPIAI